MIIAGDRVHRKGLNKNFTKIPNRVIRSRLIKNHSAFRLYSFLMSFNPSFPSYEYIQQQLGFSPTTISKGLRQLVALNLIRIKKRDVERCWANNEYEFVPEVDWLV